MLTLVPSIWRRCHVGHDVAALREQSLGHVVVALKGSVPQSYQRAEDSKILGGPVSIPVSTVLAKSKSIDEKRTVNRKRVLQCWQKVKDQWFFSFLSNANAHFGLIFGQ